MTTQTITGNEQLVADLAWEFCEKARKGEKVKMKNYLQKLPDMHSRTAFRELVNTDMLLDVAAQEHRSP